MISLIVAMAMAASGPDTLVVCPQPFREALAPWVAHRTAQGYRIRVADTGSPEEIRAAIRQSAASGALRAVLLVGDADPRAAENAQLRDRVVPTHHARAQVNVRWGSEPQIATDNWYADLDDDQIPDLAIGRLTPDSSAELTEMIGKILRYEAAIDMGMWRQRISFVAGVGGFGALADSVIETATKKFLTDGIPAAYTTTMTYGSWRSPFCPDPRQFKEIALERHDEGCLFWVYIGHGQKTFLDRIYVPGSSYPIMDVADVKRLRCRHGAPIAIFLACYTGAFDQLQDCLAEELLRSRGGPVAVLSGSRVTMPYAMAVLGNAMMDEYFVRRRETIGEVLLQAKRRMVLKDLAVDDDSTHSNRRLLDSIAVLISPEPKLLAAERREHLLLFNLLGDPLLRLRQPHPILLEVPENAAPGTTLPVAGTCPLPGRCTVELISRRDQLTFRPPPRSRYDQSASALAEFNEIYQKANDRHWNSTSFEVSRGPFRAELLVPENAYGPCHVRVHLAGQDDYALGATDVFVRQPTAAGGE